MKAWEIAPFLHRWRWSEGDEWERREEEGLLRVNGPLRVNEAEELVVTVMWEKKSSHMEAERHPDPSVYEMVWSEPTVRESPVLSSELVIARRVGAMSEERLTAYWWGAAICLSCFPGELLSARYGLDFDVDVLHRQELSTWEDFYLALTERDQMGEILGEVYWSHPAPLWLRTELRSCFPMGGERVYLDLAMNEHPKLSYPGDPETFVILERRVLRGVVRLFIEDASGALEDCLEQEVDLGVFEREIEPQRFLSGMRAHAVVLGELLGEAVEGRDWMPFDLICPDIFELKRANTQEDFEAALRAKSRLGKWL